MQHTEAQALLIALGAKVASIRKRRGLTQESLAEQIGVSPGYLRRIERGKENLTVESIGKLAASLRVGLWELIGRSPAPSSRAK